MKQNGSILQEHRTVDKQILSVVNYQRNSSVSVLQQKNRVVPFATKSTGGKTDLIGGQLQIDLLTQQNISETLNSFYDLACNICGCHKDANLAEKDRLTVGFRSGERDAGE
ncbi:hypothetical protein CDAR_574861 [Caerostris darwini]|uniref:Uncharacterized protein n=1 Tax=Caerostris darwini TaxID=1538125 RepID=A0AAV4SXQ6_9ARAC|nr:hypothetical protein CDAR_574861 [Caerostris darwini]